MPSCVAARGSRKNLYYRWSKDFLEAGKKRLAGDTARAATSDEVNDLRREAMALKEVVCRSDFGKPCSTNLSSHPRELAACFTDAERYFVSEASVYRLLKAHGLITSPAFIVMKAADEQDDGAEPALADGLHLSESDWLRLVLFVDRARRLLPQGIIFSSFGRTGLNLCSMVAVDRSV